MEYQQTLTIKGDGKALLDSTMQLLMAQGFSIVKKENFYLEVAGHNVHSSNQNPMLGASKIVFSISGRQLHVDAELKGFKKLITILSMMMVVMAIGFVMMAMFLPNTDPDFRPYHAALPLLPWVVLMPLMARIFKKRTIKTLDTFVANLAMLDR